MRKIYKVKYEMIYIMGNVRRIRIVIQGCKITINSYTSFKTMINKKDVFFQIQIKKRRFIKNGIRFMLDICLRKKQNDLILLLQQKKIIRRKYKLTIFKKLKSIIIKVSISLISKFINAIIQYLVSKLFGNN